MRPLTLITLYVVLALLPLALATGLVETMSQPTRLFATVSGLVGFAMLLMQFISSGRFESLSRRVGINRTMRFHQITARVALLLILLHPLLFFMPGSVDSIAQSANMLMRMMTSSFMLSGTIAFALVLFVVITGIWRYRLPVKYEIWRGAHVLGVTIIAIAGAHHVLTVGSNSQQPVLRTYWWAMLVLALSVIGYTYLVKPWLLRRTAYRVQSVHQVGTGIHEVALEPATGRAIDFTAGQFAWVNFRGMLPLLDNPFTISSSPHELPRVRLLIKSRGDTSGRVGQLTRGQRVYLDAPHGSFTLRYHHAEALCLIAGGIGIAAVISILRDLAHNHDERPISLIVGARSPQQLVYANEIRELQKVLRLNVFFSVDEPPADWDGGVGEISQQVIEQNLPAEPQRCLCMICGPTPMMLAVEQHLKQLGVPPKNIVYERFEYD